MFEKISKFISGIHWTSPDTLAALAIVAGVVSFSILERFFPFKKGLAYFRKGWYIDLVWYTFIQSFFLKILIFDYMIYPGEKALGIEKIGFISHWPMWVLVIFFVITHDFYIYWFHRLQHYSKILWRTHEAHHSVEQVDFLAGSRSHMVEIIINQTIEFAPIIILLDAKTAAVMIPIKGAIDALYGQFIHSNLNVRMGKLGYVFNGPILHQWHHGDQVEVYHANFATKLSLWDYIFKTAYNPGRTPARYGVWYRFPKDWFAQHIFSVFRFNVERVENNRLLKWYFDFRVNLIKLFFKTWKAIFGFRIHKRKLIDGEVYGPKPELKP